MKYNDLKEDISREELTIIAERQNDKMAALGRLSGGIAHDYNNYLMSIIGNATMIQKTDELDRIYDYAERIIHISQSAAELTKKILVFSKRKSSTNKPVNLKNVLDNTYEMMEFILCKEIKLIYSYDANDEVLNIAKENAKDPENKIIIMVDCAYIDYAGIGDERRKFFGKFSGLPKNILIIVAFSMSKGYTMYGMRSGAAIGISSDEDIAEEFYYSCMHSNRANWSNGTRAAMEIMNRIANDPEKTKSYEAEVNETKVMLRKRADAFVEGAKEVGLEILPYRDGFFVSIPCKDAKKLSDELIKENVFAIPLKKGLRFAVCAVSEEKCRIAPAIIKKALDRI